MSSLAATPRPCLRRDMISASTQTEIYQYSRIDLRNADSFGDDIAYIDESSASNTRPTSKENSNRNSKFINEHTIYITQECPEYILQQLSKKTNVVDAAIIVILVKFGDSSYGKMVSSYPMPSPIFMVAICIIIKFIAI